MLQLIQYSEKAVAIIGNTRDHKEALKKMGGRFNANLTCGAGWIFPKKAQEDLEALIAGKPSATKTEKPAKTEKPKARRNLAGMRVYVGTYHKYNEGSIAGAWLNLEDYNDKAEFMEACRRLHKDEADPEFMFQDWEGVPSWMIRESSIDAELWEYQPEKETGGQSKAEIRAILEKVLPDGRDIDYYTNKTARIVEAEGLYFDIPKPTIQTRFCHPDEPAEEVEAWREAVRTYDYFRRENMADLEGFIKFLKEGELGRPCQGFKGACIAGLFIYRDYNGLWRFGNNSDRFYMTADNKATPMDEETRQALLAGYKEVAKTFEKRLSAWWKRYGADKLHVWTYWQDA